MTVLIVWTACAGPAATPTPPASAHQRPVQPGRCFDAGACCSFLLLLMLLAVAVGLLLLLLVVVVVGGTLGCTRCLAVRLGVALAGSAVP
jgi:hypothetical protein